MDDYLNELFGSNNEEKPNETPEPQQTESAAQPEAAPQPEINQQPEYSQPQPPKQEYRYVPPINQGQYYQAPQFQPQQQQQTYYNPPGFNMAPDFQPKPKKKKTGLIVLIVIAAICAVVAFSGMSKLISSSNTPGGSSSSSSSQQEDKSGAEAEVKSSDSAAKKDADGNLTVAGVTSSVKASCVGITVYTEQSAYNYFYNYGSQNSSNGNVASGEGSGVIMSEANGKTYIMTCAHVIEDGTSFTVTLDNDKEYEATFVGADSQTDIGVISIEATGLSVATFGDSKDIEVGEDCIAIGCPGGLTFKNSVTRGIVSALDVPVSSSIGYNNECIQVDAAINPGNSGGALFNMQGQVIGINSSKIASMEYEGMGFAVPSNTAVETANSLIKNGYVAGRAKLGIEYNTLGNYTSASSILSALNEKGFEDANGTMVIRKIDDSSDLKGKVEEYDMIVAVNGKTMTSVDVLTSILSKSKPGDTVKLTIARIDNNKIKTFEIDCKLIESKK